ncbi:hypothetical protein AAF712_002008 [Marasmius tenuissimus]|uniref:Uncharacterized protein n=1 Tax=Marasmius tenuissimus TaxID=585030 RepID=A0ABR3AA09_9AGAR
MRARRNVSQGYATNRDPLQPGGPSSRTKSLSTNSIFRSSNDIMHDVFAPSNAGDPSPFPTQSLKKRARSEEVDTDLSTSSPTDSPQETGEDTVMTSNSRLADRPIKPLKKSGKPGLYTRSLPASLWPTGSAETGNVEEEEDWSTAMDGGSKPYEPMALS